MNITREMNLNANGGVLYEYGNEYIVRGVLSTDKVDQLAKAVVRSNGVSGAPILLEDIADVQVGAKLPKLGTCLLYTSPVRRPITCRPCRILL